MERITSVNFITDEKTDKLYISSLIDTVSGALDAQVRSDLKSAIVDFCPKCELLVNTRDVWARDYMPIQLTKNVFLGYTYNPDYLKDYPKCVTNWQRHHVRTKKQSARTEHLNLNVVQMPIILDGGNVVKAIVNDKPCIIMCNKVLEENHVNEENFRFWWNQWWSDNFNGTKMGLALLPWEGREINPIGHADGMVRYIGEGRILMTNYGDYDKREKDDHSRRIKKALGKAGFIDSNIVTLSYLDKFDHEKDNKFRLLFEHTWCYINYLQVGNRILVPSLGYKPLDKEAVRQIDQAFNANKHIADIQLIDVDMTSIVDDIGARENSGGGLNCLTWTTFGDTQNQ